MPLIGHSDEDLRKREAALQDASTELEKQKSDLASQKTLLNHEKEVFKAQKTSFEAEREQMEKDREILEARRQEVLRLEAAAKANFTETQRKTFEEVMKLTKGNLKNVVIGHSTETYTQYPSRTYEDKLSVAEIALAPGQKSICL